MKVPEPKTVYNCTIPAAWVKAADTGLRIEASVSDNSESAISFDIDRCNVKACLGITDDYIKPDYVDLAVITHGEETIDTDEGIVRTDTLFARLHKQAQKFCDHRYNVRLAKENNTKYYHPDPDKGILNQIGDKDDGYSFDEYD